MRECPMDCTTPTFDFTRATMIRITIRFAIPSSIVARHRYGNKSLLSAKTTARGGSSAASNNEAPSEAARVPSESPNQMERFTQCVAPTNKRPKPQTHIVEI